MPEEGIPRVLRETIPGGLTSLVSSDEVTTLGFSGYFEWEDPGHYYKLFLGYFDLSGYTREKMTYFIQNVLFQQIGNNELAAMQATAGIEECRIVTTTPMSQGDFSTAPDSTFTMPGNPLSTFGLDQVVRASCLNYEMNLGAATAVIAQASTWGLADSTAAEKLYYARCFRFDRQLEPTGAATYKVMLAPIAVVVPGVALEEESLDYVMRLKRSVDYANQS